MIKEINFSKKAVERINQLIAKKPSGTFFRIAVKGGGCSGFKYDFSFDDKIDEVAEVINGYSGVSHNYLRKGKNKELPFNIWFTMSAPSKEKLEENILAEGHLYEGDLLNAVLTSDMNYWKREKMNYEIVHKLFDKNQEKVKDSNLGKDLFKSYKEFKKLD